MTAPPARPTPAPVFWALLLLCTCSPRSRPGDTGLGSDSSAQIAEKHSDKDSACRQVPPIDLDDWSVANRIVPEAQARQCLAERGCPSALSIPPCPADVVASCGPRIMPRDVEEHRPGAKVVVNGTLMQLSRNMTLKACESGCCNHSFAMISFANDVGRMLATPMGEPIRCTGDESQLCCPFAPPERPVIVIGEVVEVDPSGAHDKAIVPLQICELPGDLDR